jgi:hypothetical protein
MSQLGAPHPVARIAAALAAAAVALAGCGHDSSSTPSAGTPTEPTACNDLGTHRGDGFVLAGSHWTGETHAYDESATVYACVLASGEGTVRFQVSGNGIVVTPARRQMTAYPGGVVPFQVRVSPGASGRLVMLQQGPGRSSSGGPGPAVVGDSDGWHFASSD